MSKQLDEKAAEALARLGHTEDEIAELAEKQKALPEEENVVEKEDATQGNVLKRLWQELGKAFGGEPESVPEASEPDEAEKAEEVVPVPADKQVEDAPEAEATDARALVQALGETVAKSIGVMVKEQLDERDKRIAALESLVQQLGESAEERAEQVLRDVPPVVKVSASTLVAPSDGQAVKGLTFGRAPEETSKRRKQFLDDIARVVDEKVKGAGFQV